MNFVKKYPIFVAVLIVSIIALIAGSVLSFMAMGRLSASEDALSSAKRQLDSLTVADPSPVRENIESLESNIADLKASFAKAKNSLETSEFLTVTEDSDVLLPIIVKYIRDFRSRAEASELITIKEDEAFGFPGYATGKVDPPENDKVPLIDKQRLILTYLVQRLFDASEMSGGVEVLSIKRELIEKKESEDSRSSRRRRGRDEENKQFVIDPALTARVENAVHTYAFELKFAGYTEALRIFIESLTKFELPVVVRSVEVQRKETPKSTKISRTVSDLFDTLGSADSEALKSVVVDQNTSEFTVTVEYIEVLVDQEGKQL